MGSIKGIDLNISDTDIHKGIKSSGAKIIEVHRCNRRNKEGAYVPSTTLQVIFEGRALPNNVAIWNSLHEVELFIPPVKKCPQCYRFGHSRKDCRANSQKCDQCNNNAHTDGEPCPTANPKCVHCLGPHKSSARDCPEFIKQKEKHKIAAQANISYAEARSRLGPTPNRFTQPPLPPLMSSSFPNLRQLDHVQDTDSN